MKYITNADINDELDAMDAERALYIIMIALGVQGYRRRAYEAAYNEAAACGEDAPLLPAKGGRW